MNYLAVVIRILKGIANALNMSKKKKYAENPASTIANANDGELFESDNSFSDLANEAKRNKAE